MQKYMKKYVSCFKDSVVHGKEIVNDFNQKLAAVRKIFQKKPDDLSNSPFIDPSVKEFLKNYEKSIEEDIMIHFKNRFSKQG